MSTISLAIVFILARFHLYSTESHLLGNDGLLLGRRLLWNLVVELSSPEDENRCHSHEGANPRGEEYPTRLKELGRVGILRRIREDQKVRAQFGAHPVTSELERRIAGGTQQEYCCCSFELTSARSR